MNVTDWIIIKVGENRIIFVKVKYIFVLISVFFGLSGFCLTLFLIQAGSRQFSKKQSEKISSVTKGGSELTPKEIRDFCLSDSEPQEIKNKRIKHLLTKMLRLSKNEKFVIIDRSLYLYSLIVASQQDGMTMSLIPFLSPLLQALVPEPLEVIVPNAKKLLLKGRTIANLSFNIGIMVGGFLSPFFSVATASYTIKCVITAYMIKHQILNSYIYSQCKNELGEIVKINNEISYLPSAVAQETEIGPRFVIASEDNHQIVMHRKDNELIINDFETRLLEQKFKEKEKAALLDQALTFPADSAAFSDQSEICPDQSSAPSREISEAELNRLIPISKRTKTLKDVKELDSTAAYEEYESFTGNKVTRVLSEYEETQANKAERIKLENEETERFLKDMSDIFKAL